MSDKKGCGCEKSGKGNSIPVKDIQHFLNRYNFTDENNRALKVDGIDGDKTSSAVFEFQAQIKEYKKEPDGLMHECTVVAMLKFHTKMNPPSTK
jgi:hypothetical protein